MEQLEKCVVALKNVRHCIEDADPRIAATLDEVIAELEACGRAHDGNSSKTIEAAHKGLMVLSEIIALVSSVGDLIGRFRG